tara:strand:- start:24 stop:416 length:393 start_codon:yes stop_codon:yes gene_type:complete
MSDVLNIKVTEAELDLITLLLEQAGTMEDSDGQPAFELLHDLMEQAARPGDWTEDLEPTEIVDPSVNHTFTATEQSFIQAGINAREQAKASSRAAERRALNFSGHRDDGELSETQKHDLWSKPSNDPADW